MTKIHFNFTRKIGGSSLVTIITLSGSLLLMLGTLLSYSSVSQAQVLRENYTRQALSLGNGGINRALALYRTNANYRSESYALTTGAVDIAIQDTGTGQLTLNVQTYVPAKNHPRGICRPYQVNITESGELVSGTYLEGPPCTNTTTTGDTNSAPTLSILQPDTSGYRVAAGKSFDIIYTLSDNNPSDVVKATFFYTPGTGILSPKNEITGACSIAPAGTNTRCQWNIPQNTPPGDYSIYGEATDGVNTPISAFSPGKLTIFPFGAPDFTINTPTSESNDYLTVGDSLTISYSLTDNTETAITAALAYDPDTDPTNNNHTAITTCGGVSEATPGTCIWETTAVSPGDYSIRGTTSGAIANITTYSPGKVTVTSNTRPSLEVTEPSVTNQNVTGQNTFKPKFIASDDDSLKITLYYDTDATGFNGTAIPVDPNNKPRSCTDVSPLGNGQETECEWDLSQMAPGTYYVYGIATGDLYERVTKDYSPGSITIDVPPVNSLPQLSITEPNGYNDSVVQQNTCCAQYTIKYSLSDVEETVTANLSYSTSQSSAAAMTQISTCTNLVEGNGQCIWNVPTTASGAYYIHGSTTDTASDPNRTVRTVSAGPLTIIVPPVCSDNRDNDGDGRIDFPTDPGCTDANDADEKDPPINDWGVAVAKDSAERIYMAGYSETSRSATTFVRKYSGGTLCKTGTSCGAWGDNGSGMVTFSHSSGYARVTDVTIDSNNNLFVIGNVGANPMRHWLILKYTAAGVLDTTFDGDGILIETASGYQTAQAISIDSQSNLYVTGGYNQYSFATRKYNANGELCNGQGACSNWGSGGMMTSSVFGAVSDNVLDSNGNLYIAGYDNNTNMPQGYVVKYTAAGGQDGTFGTNGIITYRHNDKNTTFGRITIDGQNNLYLAGAAGSHSSGYSEAIIAKYNANGKLYDGTQATPAWGIAANGVNTFYDSISWYGHCGSTDIVAQSDGTLYASLYCQSVGSIQNKYQPNGAYDTSYGTSGSARIYGRNGGRILLIDTSGYMAHVTSERQDATYTYDAALYYISGSGQFLQRYTYDSTIP